MATRYRFGDSSVPHFITFGVVNWIDVFSRECYKEIMIDSLKYCIEQKGLILHAWIIMTNHVHLIASAKTGTELAAIMRDLKKYTSRMILAEIEANGQESRKSWMIWMFKHAGGRNSNNKIYQFWQQDNHPIELSTNKMLDTRLNYLHENPVRAGLVWDISDYKYSSATDYCGQEAGLIPIEML